jgi:hypothetical protein
LISFSSPIIPVYKSNMFKKDKLRRIPLIRCRGT